MAEFLLTRDETMKLFLNVPESFTLIDGISPRLPIIASNINELLLYIKAKYPILCDRIMGNNDELLPFVGFYHNNERIEDFNAPLPDKSEVAMICAIAGG